MTGRDFVSEHFPNVDQAPDPAKLVSYLDRATSTEHIQRLKQATYEPLALEQGQTVLDVGCGLGDDVRTLAEIVGSTGRAVGLDYSQTLISEAHARSKSVEVRISFVRADSCRLPFPDAAFDAIRSERMLQHLREPIRAVREMARVAKPGGRVVDFDPDWDMMAIDSSDLAITRKIVHFHTDMVVSGSVGRRLSGLFGDVGLVDIRVVPMATVFPSFAMVNSLLGLEATVERATAAGAISDADASAWIAELQERDSTGRFFCGICGYIVSGRKA